MESKISKKKGAVIALVLLLAVTGLFVFLGIFSYDDELNITAMDETNTKEFATIVQQVKFENDGVNIYIEGYDWYLSSSVKVKEKDLRKKFKTLEPGEKIYYRVAYWDIEAHPNFPDSSVNFYTNFLPCVRKTKK